MGSVARLTAVISSLVCFLSTAPSPVLAAIETAPKSFSEEIEAVLSEKSKEFQSFLQDEVIVNAIRSSNLEHQNWTLDKIMSEDARFRSAKLEDPWIQGFMNNPGAQRLVRYQKDHKGYVEIFIADAIGLNVSQTNKTSDYYQADEDWWKQTYGSGAGKAHHGPIEFDESAQSQAMSIYVPIMENDPPRAIGVAKAVLDIDRIKEEL